MSLNTLKCKSCNIVISEVLAYIQYKQDVMDNESLIKICDSSFSDEEIVCAKSLLFESVSAELAQRKISRRKDGKKKRNIENIINLFKEQDPDSIPIFVARDLLKLPPVAIDHIDAVSLLKDVMNLRNEIKCIKDTYVTVERFQRLESELQNRIITPITNHQNVNTRKRGGYLDSGPIGLLHEVNSITEGIQNTADECTANVCEINDNTRNAASCSHAQQGAQAVSVSPEREQTNGTITWPASRHHRQSMSPTVITHELNSVPIEKQCNVNKMETLTIADVVRKQGDVKINKPSESWTLVQKKRYKNRFIGKTGKAIMESSSKFKAADVKIPLFITNVSKECSEIDITEYIHSKTMEKISLEKIKMKEDRPYNAFKLSVLKTNVHLYLNSDMWPDGIKFRRFIHFRKRSLQAKEPQPEHENSIVNGQQQNK